MHDQSATQAWAKGHHRTGGTAPRDEHFDERLLVAQAKSGRSNAFAELYERHRLKIYRTVFRILRNQEDAEDAAQRSFQRAFTKLSRFRGDSTFSTWLTRIAINEALMMLRQRRANKHLFGSDADENSEACTFGLADKRPTPEEALAENELRSTVTQAISRLRKNLQIVVLLRDLQGLTSAETAQRLGLSVAAVKARNFHARRYLRRQLERNLVAGWSGLPIEKRSREIVRQMP
jgi:RNA polymerase sigma-70 factor (ECF subfamily)